LRRHQRRRRGDPTPPVAAGALGPLSQGPGPDPPRRDPPRPPGTGEGLAGPRRLEPGHHRPTHRVPARRIPERGVQTGTGGEPRPVPHPSAALTPSLPFARTPVPPIACSYCMGFPSRGIVPPFVS